MTHAPEGLVARMAQLAEVAPTQLVQAAGAPFNSIAGAFADPSPPIEGLPPPPMNPARRVQQVAAGLMGTLSMPMDLINTGFAMATAWVPSTPMPAATMLSLYVGPPHGHAHPPSLVPPSVVPIPLPSLGPMMIGTSVKVLIGGLPAARAGDIAMSVTCCSLAPGAATFTGSSKVFIAGTRAARQLDIMNACMKDVGGPVRGVAAAMMAAGAAVGLAGVVADSVDAGSVSDPHLAAAYGVAAQMGAAQLASDAVALAMSALLGADPGTPALPGMVATLTSSKVSIGGFPMINIPDPAQWLLKKAENRWQNRQARRRQAADGENEVSCPRCAR